MPKRSSAPLRTPEPSSLTAISRASGLQRRPPEPRRAHRVGRLTQERTMPLFQDQIRRIVERLAQMRSRNAATFENSAAHVTQALEDVTEAVKNIEQRLQQVEKDTMPGSPPAASTASH